MGMYDYFKCDTSCPICGCYIDEIYQTKNFECLMSVYKPGMKVDVEGPIRVYTHCDHEKRIIEIKDGAVFSTNRAVWIEHIIPIVNREISRNQNLWKTTYGLVEYNSMSFIPDGVTDDEAILRYKKFNSKKLKDIEITTFERLNKEWE